jgi:hypothetical protein
MRAKLWDSSELEVLVYRLLDQFKVPGIALAVVDGEKISVKVRKTSLRDLLYLK